MRTDIEILFVYDYLLSRDNAGGMAFIIFSLEAAIEDGCVAGSKLMVFSDANRAEQALPI